MPSNSENTEWNIRYNGARCPVNDTGLVGAPFALKSSDANWTEGSVNKAVYDTLIQNGDFPLNDDNESAINGEIDLGHAALYVNSDMLYGYLGDARGKVPGDMMSYRGYPTQVVKSFNLVLDSPSSATKINYDGSIGDPGDSIVLKHTLEYLYKLPYNSSYIIEYFLNTISKLKILVTTDLGNINITKYSIIEVDGVVDEDLEPEEFELPQGALYFSLPILGLTGSQTFSIQLVEFSSGDPYYGAIATQTVVVTEAEYSPTNNWRSLGVSTKLLEPFDMSYYLNSCSEIDKIHVIQGTGVELFRAASAVVQIGTTLYKDTALQIPATGGKYIWTTYAYNSGSGVYFRIQSYIQLDVLGKIILYYPNMSTIGSLYCAIGGPPLEEPLELI